MRRVHFSALALLSTYVCLGCGTDDDSGSTPRATAGAAGMSGAAGATAGGGGALGSGGTGGSAGSASGGTGGSQSQPGDAPSATFVYTESDEIFDNPERGFYSAVDLTSETDLGWVRDAGHTLAFSYVRLDDYRTADLPSSLLDAASSGLAVARAAGLKIILRFAYNAGPYPDSEPDASKQWVLTHISELEPLLTANEDVIALVQAGFIGAWGEWHTSTNGLDNPTDRRDILLALLAALPESRMTQLRYPPDRSEIFGAAPADADAFDGSDAARTGLHNDCFVASDTDLGTYPSDAIESWKDYVAQAGRFTVVGGETCAVDAPRSECASATAEMERLHFSFINEDYNPDVVDAWKSGGCYSEMQRRLGYRLALTQSSFAEAVRPGGSFALEIELDNVGYAALFNPRPLYVVLEGQGQRLVALASSVDVRRWAPGATASVALRLRVPSSLPAGSYRLALWLPDAAAALEARADYAVRFANAGVWQASTGDNTLGEIAISEGASGTVDASASEFTVID